MNDGHLRSQGTEEMGQFGSDISTTHDGEPPGLLRQSQGLVGSDIRNISQAGNIRDQGSGTGSDYNCFPADSLPGHFQGFLLHKPARSLEHSDI